ncbi:MAG: hypothetical protein OEZ43_10225 [Gammaproteobacteria bacterium]|nr:hypothetical protein [Gammaproteobacteria bacterium]
MGRVVGALIVVCFLLSSCSALNWVKDGAQRDSTSKELDIPEQKEQEDIALGSEAMTAQELLALYEGLYKAPSKEIKQHRELAKEQFREHETLDKGIEYVLILILSGRTEDLAEARSVVKSLQKSKSVKPGDGYIALVELLGQITLHRVHAAERIGRLEKRLEKRESELETIKEQLNALKSIDKNIHEREVGTIHDGR